MNFMLPQCALALTAFSSTAAPVTRYVDLNCATLHNCISYFNTADASGTNNDSCVLYYSCSEPLPSAGAGNFTNTPLFMDLAAGDLHLQATSPCINAGRNAYGFTATDRDGNPRIAGGTVGLAQPR